jgi:hypothetical protein
MIKNIQRDEVSGEYSMHEDMINANKMFEGNLLSAETTLKTSA